MTLRSLRRQRRDRGADAIAHFALLIRFVGRLRLGGHERRRQRRAVDVLAGRERRRRLDRVDPDDGAAEPRFVGSDARREVGERRLRAELAPKLLARGLELATLAAHAARPRIAAQRVDHRAPHAALRKGLELDASRLVEAAGGVNQSEHAVLNEVPQLDRMGHRGGHPSGQRFDKGQAGGDSFALIVSKGLTLHRNPLLQVSPSRLTASLPARRTRPT